MNTYERYQKRQLDKFDREIELTKEEKAIVNQKLLIAVTIATIVFGAILAMGVTT